MKRNLLKAIGISFLIFVILSWIIPVGTYTSGELETNGIDAVGIFDLFSIPISTILVFATYIIVFAVIGGLYGVMSKTGALDKLTDKLAGKFSKKEKTFLVITIIFYVLLSSVTGLIIPLFVLVPLSAMVLFKLNFTKVVAMASTVGSILIGSAASTFGFNISGYTKNLLSLEMTNQIVAKVILLVVITVIFIIFVLKFSKNLTKPAVIKETVKKVEESKEQVKKETPKTATKKSASKTTTKKAPAKKATAKKTTKKSTQAMAISKSVKKVNKEKRVSTVPLIVIFALMVIVTFVGMYNWYYSFDINFFNDLYDDIMGVKIGDFAIFEHLFSGITQMGYWGNTEFVVMMIIASAIIAWLYRLSLHEYVESFISGMKKMMPTAIYAGLASVILYVLYQASYSGTGTLVDTMFAKTFELSDGFNVITTAIASLYGSFFYNDLYYLLAGMSAYVTGFDASALSVAGLLIQSVYAVAMLIFPTSVVLIAGLSFFDVSYKQWFKYIWKFALLIFLIILLVCAILTVL